MKEKINTFALNVLEELKTRRKFNATKTLKLDDILVKDETGKTLLEYMLEYNVSYYYGLIPGIKSSYEAVKILYKNNKINEITNIPNSIFLTKENDTYFLEELITSKEIDQIHNLSFEFDIRIIDILHKHNRKDLLKHIRISQLQLLSEVETNKIALEYLIDNNVLSDIEIPKFEYDSNIIEILSKNNRLNLIELIPFSEEILLKNNGKLLNQILEKGYYPNLKYVSRKMIDYLYNINRPDVLVNLFIHENKLEYLFSLVLNNETVIEYLLKQNNPNINYRNLAINVDQIVEDQDYIDTYLMFAKYNKLEYLYSFSSSDLLKPRDKNSCLLDMFLKTSPELTKKMITYYKLDTDLDLILFFRLHGKEYDTSNGIDFDLLDSDAYAREYLIEQNKKIKQGLNINEFTEEEMTLLMELENLIVNEENRDIVDTIIMSYAVELQNGNENALTELKTLVNIISSNPSFKVQKSQGASYFSQLDGLHIDILSVNNINHELGHLFHYYLTNYETPQELDGIITRIKENKDIKDKIQSLTLLLVHKMDQIDSDVSEEYEEWSEGYYTAHKLSEIKEFIEMSKEDKIEYYKKQGYSQEELEIILDESFTLDQYISNQKRIKCAEMSNNILLTHYSELIAICDIIDAIFDGDYYHSKLKTKNNETIKGVFGHGIGYYYSKDIVFQEILANYSAILKSDRKEESLTILESMIGRELLELLDDFYENRMLKSNIYLSSHTL